MRRPISVLIALVVMAAMVGALAAPALANHRGFFDNDVDCFEVDGFLICDEETEQDAESGDVDQSFDVSQTGDNSNQCVSTQGVANTGNTQTVGSFDLLGGDFDDFDIDDSGADIDVGGTNTTDCTSEVNQAASASG